jgi:hypothetical protein
MYVFVLHVKAYLSSALMAAALLSVLPLPPLFILLPAEEGAVKLFSIS